MKLPSQTNKRKTVKKLIATTTMATIVTKGEWHKPLVHTTILPTHAQSSPDPDNGGGGGNPCTEICGPLSTALNYGWVGNLNSADGSPFITVDNPNGAGTVNLDFSELIDADVCINDDVLTLRYLGTEFLINRDEPTLTSQLPPYLQSAYPQYNGTYPQNPLFNFSIITELNAYLGGAPYQINSTPPAYITWNLANGNTTIWEVDTDVFALLFQTSCENTLAQDAGMTIPFQSNGTDINLFNYEMQTFANGLAFSTFPEAVIVEAVCN